MAFDKDAFLAAFLGRVTTGIEERREEAKEYEQKQTEAAERNAALVQQRNMRAQQAAQIGKRAMALGASEAQVRTAMSSGMTGITELHQKLQEAVGQKGVKTLGAADIEAIVNMPSIPAVNTEMMDGSLDDFAKRTYGAMPIERAAVEDDTNIVGRLFGFGAMDRTKQKLAETDYMGGMTVADINAMSRQTEYQQLIPGAYMTFADVDYFTAEAALDFNTKLTKAMSDAVGSSAGKDYIKRARNNAIDKGEDPNVAAQTAEQYLQTTAAKPLIDYFAETYYAGGFFNNKLATQQIKTVMGETYLNDLMELYATEAPDEEEVVQQEVDTVITEKVDADQPVELVEPVTPVESVEPIDTEFPQAEPLSNAQKEILRDRFAGQVLEDEIVEEYTRDQWKEMSRKERKERGLPVSKAGSWTLHFRDEVDEILKNRNLNMDRKENVEQASYKIRLRGGQTYHITAEELASMDDSFFEGLSPTLYLMPYREGEKHVKKKITTTLVSKFAKRD